MEISVHQEKITILSRLMKDGHLSLEEALTLLKVEDEPKRASSFPFISSSPGNTGYIRFDPNTTTFTQLGSDSTPTTP